MAWPTNRPIVFQTFITIILDEKKIFHFMTMSSVNDVRIVAEIQLKKNKQQSNVAHSTSDITITNHIVKTLKKTTID